MKIVMFVLMAAGMARADALSFGVRGGAPFGEAFEKESRFNLVGRNRFLLGPTLELRLPMGFGASFDFLYRRFVFEAAGTERQGAGQWEFPLMLRYRFPGVAARPFLAAGPIFHKITGITSPRSSSAGVVFGAGLDLKVPLLNITPEIRYSRRFQDVVVLTGPGSLDANKNQVDFVVGFTF